MRLSLLFFIFTTFISSIFSQKLYERIGDYYYHTDHLNFFKGESISNMKKIDSMFLIRGFEKYLDYDFGSPFVFLDGKALFISLSAHLSFSNTDSTFNYIVFATSELFNISVLSSNSGFRADLNDVFAPHKFFNESNILYGLGIDSLGNPIALSVLDSTLTVYDFPCELEIKPLAVNLNKYKLDKPFDFGLSGEGRFKCINIWQEKIGIVGLVGGIHKVLFSPDGIKVLETYESPKNIIRRWECPFYPTHEITSEGN